MIIILGQREPREREPEVRVPEANPAGSAGKTQTFVCYYYVDY